MSATTTATRAMHIDDEGLQQTQLRQLLRSFAAISLMNGTIIFVLGLIFETMPIILLGVLIYGDLIIYLVALRDLGQKRKTRAVIWFYMANLYTVLGVAIIFPIAYPALVLYPVYATVLVLQFTTSNQFLLKIMFMSWITTIGMMALVHFVRFFEDPPPLVANLIVTVTILVVIAVIFGTLWTYYSRLNLALRAAREANLFLEAQVAERTSELKQALDEKTIANDLLSKTNVELVAARKTADEANRLKTRFLANMSHELRTPLNAIINFTKRVRNDESVDETHRTRLERVVFNGEHLLGLINDILDLSKIESGKMELFPENMDIRAIFNGVMSTAIGLTKDKEGVTLVTDISDNVPGTIYLDKTKIRQILLNLLSNAAKFTEEGPITLRARVRADDMLEISVQDSGIGIAPEHHERIFEEFRQVEDNLQRHHQGTGLGLPICKKLVQLHGGSMWLESEVGKGATFFFTLPLQQAQDPTNEEPLDAVVGRGIGEPTQKRIVVVDDNVDALHVLRGMLSDLGYGVITIQDSRIALATIAEIQPPPALILLDILMPNVDGWEILTQLKGNPQTAPIPVVLCSVIEHKRYATTLGATDYLVKPVDQDALLGIMNRWCTSERASVLVVDDNPDARAIVRSMLERLQVSVDEASDGIEGLARIASTHPNMVILDLMMPQMDGFELLRQLRAQPEYQDLPVVVLSAKDLTSEERQWLCSESQAYLSKLEVDADQFIKLIQTLLS